MDSQAKRLILANGEAFVTGIDKRAPGWPSEPPASYEEARVRVRDGIRNSLSHIADLPPTKRFSDELVLCLRLHPDMTAKSYEPQHLFNAIPGIAKVGSRTYRVNANEVKETKKLQKRVDRTESEIVTGRLLFTRADPVSYERFLLFLEKAESSLTKEFCKDIRRIQTYNLLSAEEQCLGFSDEWTEGRVEIIFHPSALHSSKAQLHFLSELLPDPKAFRSGPHKVSIAPYSEGPTFVSCWLSRAELEALQGANPLRALHPLRFRSLGNLRGSPRASAPNPPSIGGQSNIKVGMFDGGVDVNHDLLHGHVEQDDSLSIKTDVDPDCLEHGTAVAGVILYGPLNSYDASATLPLPAVSVVSFRVLPCSDAADQDLYESIDIIERVIPARPDINTYNLSFGPEGPILDDAISRFTHSLDTLSTQYNVGFYVAVGNDGELPDGENRIQSPSDLVNGIGVGAITKRRGDIVHAPYSCHGPGRECGKVKPDLVAFGGCELTPIHLISVSPGDRLLKNGGTSFAAPSVAAMAGRLTGGVDRATPLLARALLVHSARHPSLGPDVLMGYGIAETDFDAILRCGDRSFTVVYQGDISDKKYVKLPFLVPPGMLLPGRVTIKWTIAILPDVDPNHPTEYTVCGVEDTFYPHNGRYRFTPPLIEGERQESPRTLTNPSAEEVMQLTQAGWRQSEYPVSKSPRKYATEEELRENTNKWEPLIKRMDRMRGTGLQSPFLILHAIPRNGWNGSVRYAVVATIEIPKSTADIYGEVLTAYPALQPIRLRSEAEIRIRP
ncbi:MAG TPA: S8 family peptidase [Candidatus Kapabacteria bacterium]|nr:S8 family peptidase [Candidatus Kapabacteria bacterium]